MKLIIRADASRTIGTGHVMRCLALAQAWQVTPGKAIFVMATEVPALEARLKLEGFEIFHLPMHLEHAEDARKTASLAKQLDANWVVVDGYQFSAEYQRIIKNFGLKLLFIDDYGHAEHYYADIVLNQNLFADESLYKNREPYTQLLLGTKYILLRREFWQYQGWQHINPFIASKILVTMGGADPDNVTFKVIQGLQLLSVNDLEVVVVVGGSNPHYEQLKLLSEISQLPIRLENNVTNMPELMAWADLVVTAGGSTCWELAFMGLPSVILILAKNQRTIAQKLDEMGVTIDLGWHEDASAAEIASVVRYLLMDVHTRAEMTRRGQELVDSEGSKRVLRYLEAKLFKLRLVCQEDCRLLWEWSNDPEVRYVSFSTEPIAWENHVQWFQSRLDSPHYIIYIIVDRNNLPVGMIRYELEGKDAMIAITIDKNFRHQGYGSNFIELGSEEISKSLNIINIHAYIKPNNKISIKAFSRSGFHNMGITQLRGHEAVHLIRTNKITMTKLDARN